jgi:drug/metabolite transporter (DMT)-like permease
MPGMAHDDSTDVRHAQGYAAALAALHVAVALFGFAALFGKWIALPAPMIVLGRTAVAALALAALLVTRGEGRGRYEWRLGVNGALLAAHWVAFFQAVQTASVAIGLLGFASFPLFVVLLEAVLLRRPAGLREWLLACLVATGLVVIAPAFELSDRNLQGLLWGVFAGASFALLAVGNRALASRRSAGEIAFWQNAVAALCLLPALVIAPALPTARDLVLLLVLGLVCTALAHTLFIRSLRALSAHTASVVACLEPVYGIVLAVVLLGEIPALRTLCGGALIVGASSWATLAAGGRARRT